LAILRCRVAAVLASSMAVACLRLGPENLKAMIDFNKEYGVYG
jgi:hypothetical protein